MNNQIKKMKKITYWKIAYFSAPAVVTLLVEIFFWGWSSGFGGTKFEEISSTYLFFSWVFSCPLGCLSLGILYLLGHVVNPSDISIDYAFFLIFIVTTSALGYFQWFYLLPKWLKWFKSRRERAEE